MVDDPLGGSRKRRDRLFIMAEMLELAREGVLKTRIMYGANLSFAQLNEYLSLLLDLNLLKVIKNSSKTVYKTTEKGLRYLKGYKEIRELLKNRKGNNPKGSNSLYLVKHGTRMILP